MKVTVEVTEVQNGVSEKDGRDPIRYARLLGHNATTGKFVRAVCYNEVADAMLAHLASNSMPNESISSLRPMFEFEGEWRDAFDKKLDKKIYSLRVDKFTPVTGPSMENVRTKKGANDSLARAAKAYGAGDIHDAYLVLEEFVARIAHQPRPSETNDASVTPPADEAPEERAARRYRQSDARRDMRVPGAEAAKPSAAPETKPEEPAVVGIAAELVDARIDASAKSPDVDGASRPDAVATETAAEPVPDAAESPAGEADVVFGADEPATDAGPEVRETQAQDAAVTEAPRQARPAERPQLPARPAAAQRPAPAAAPTAPSMPPRVPPRFARPAPRVAPRVAAPQTAQEPADDGVKP